MARDEAVLKHRKSQGVEDSGLHSASRRDNLLAVRRETRPRLKWDSQITIRTSHGRIRTRDQAQRGQGI